MSTGSAVVDRPSVEPDLAASPAVAGSLRTAPGTRRRRAVAAPPSRGSAGRRPAAVARPVKVVVQPASIPAPPPSRPSGVRLTRRGRLLVSCLTVALALGMFLVGRAFPGSAADGAVAASPATPVASVVVQPGDTLWGLAVRIAPDSDPRRTVDMLRNLNRLDSGQLSVGQTLRVPVAP